jgi:hypothetical protein
MTNFWQSKKGVVFENRMRRTIFGPRRKRRGTGGSRKLFDEFYNIYILPSIICNNQIGDATEGHVASMADIKTFTQHFIRDIRK